MVKTTAADATVDKQRAKEEVQQYLQGVVQHYTCTGNLSLQLVPALLCGCELAYPCLTTPNSTAKVRHSLTTTLTRHDASTPKVTICAMLPTHLGQTLVVVAAVSERLDRVDVEGVLTLANHRLALVGNTVLHALVDLSEETVDKHATPTPS